MRRIGRDKLQLAAVTAVGAFGFLVLLPLLGGGEVVLPRGWSPPPATWGTAGPGPVSALTATAPGPAAAAASDRAVPAAATPAASALPGDGAAPLEAHERPTRAERRRGDEGERAPGEAARIEGQVVDPEGRPAAGAQVIVRGERRRERREGPSQTTCDPQGRFQLTLSPGTWALWAEGEGWAPGEPVRVRLQPGQRELLEEPLRLAGAALLRGRVRDEQGRALGGAQVRVNADRYAWEGETDQTGVFSCRLGEGTCQVQAQAPGYVTATAQRVPVALTTGGEVELVLNLGGALEGLVLDGEGRPLSGAHVFAYRGGEHLGNAPSDEGGRFRMEGLLPGPVELFARSRDKAECARGPGEVRAGQTLPVTLRLAAGASVVGQLTRRDGQPLADVEVQARSVDGDVRRNGKSDAAGRFTIGQLYPGRYRITAAGRGAPRAEAELEVTAGEVRCDLQARGESLLAGVVVGADGRPVAGAGVFAIQGSDQRAETRSDEQGAFRLEGLPAGEYRVFARLDQELAGTTPPLALTEDGAQEGLRLVVLPPATLRGQVLDGAGQAVAGLELVARGRETPVRRSATTDAEGRFEMRPFYDGAYELRARGEGLALEARRRGAAEAHLAPRPFEVLQGRDVHVDLRLETR